MSNTITAGIYPTESWTFMARSMSMHLEDVIKAGRIEKDSFPEGVYQGAVKFFRLAIDEGGESSISDVATKLHIENIAATTVERDRKWSSDEDTDEQIRRLQEFLLTLKRIRELSKDDIEKAMALNRFFKNLAEAGEAVMYHNVVRMTLPGEMDFRIKMRNGRLVRS